MRHSNTRTWAIVAFGLIAMAGISSFRPDHRDRGGLKMGYNSMLDFPSYAQNDSTPGKSKSNPEEKMKQDEKDFDIDMHDFDQSMHEFEKSMEKFGEEFNNEKWEKAQKEFSKALKDIDFDKIMLNSQKAWKSVDWDKINDDINSSFKSIDWDQMNKSMDMAFNQIEKNKEFMKLNWEKTWKQSMEGAKKGIETAKIEMRKLHDFVHDLEKDGLIKKGEPFIIEIDHGKLIINGKEQSKEATDKYRNSEKYKSYFEKDKDWKIKSDGKDGGWEDDDVI
ncbi:MAG: hypothetical protein C5B52_12910 [Bacteroidetes bacterium]|nr:MAG: hypothetical protein C5B52_12910 [Bacteroidota bacterium]